MVKISSLKRKLERLTLMTACAISFVILAAYADSVAGPWTQVATTGPPSPRSNHGLAYDSARGVTVLFGGYVEAGPAAGQASDTWVWDGSTWKQVATTGPSPRYDISMAYDSARGVTVLFGGFATGPPAPRPLADTWEWDGSLWKQVATTGPSPRFFNELAYDSTRGVTVLFGGFDLASNLGDTWEWDGGTWARVANTGPSPRFGAAMAYDSARRVTVLFGGWDGNSVLGDTWEWDGGTWARVANTGPSPRRPISLAYDSNRRVSILFGGWDGATSLGDTWEWDGRTWTQAATTGPSARQTSLAYDSVRAVTVLYGGYPAPGDTWAFSGTQHNRPPVIDPIGDQAAFEGTLVQFTIRASDPDNNILTYSASNLPAGATFDAASGVFSWIPSYDQGGTTYLVIFSVTDGIASVSRQVSITVGNVNRLPVLAPIGTKTVREGEFLSFVITAADPDGDSLTYSATNLPEGAKFDPVTQTFSWIPGYSQDNRSYTDIEFSVHDGQGGVSSELINITVTNVNRPPEFSGMASQYTGQESQPITFRVSAMDPDGDTIHYSADGLPAGASFDATSGNFFWIPSLGQAGTIYMVMFHASDGALTTDFGVCISVQTLTPSQLADAIVGYINNLKLPKEVRNSLVANTKKVGIFVEGGRVIAAINQLDALIDKVQREIVWGSITEADGSNLVQAATYLKDKLRGG